MGKISCGVIGCGAIGKRHIEEILKNNNTELTAICDLNKEIADNIGESCILSEPSVFVSVYIGYKNLLSRANGINLISICTPNDLHAQMAIEFLNAGKHVLVEKPMALTRKDCELMIQAAIKNDTHLIVVKQNRFNLPIKALKKALMEDKLGKILYISANCFWNRNKDYYSKSGWKGGKDREGGALYTQFSHFMDALLYLKDFGVEAVTARMSNVNHTYLDIEDTGSVILHFIDDTQGLIEYTTNAFGGNMESSITLFTEKGTYKVGGQYLNKLDVVQGVPIELENEKEPISNNYGTYQGSAANHKQIYESVANTLLNGSPVHVSGMEGMWVVEAIEAAYKSSNLEETVIL